MKISTPIARFHLKSTWPYLAGLILLLGMCVSYVGAGGNAVVSAHDQLDGFYMKLYVEHFSDGFVPEIMNGVSLGQITLTPPLFVVPYFILDVPYAYLVSYAVIMIAAYIGMALLCSICGVRPWVSTVASFAFAILPFFSVYGLSVMGIPFVVWATMRYWRDVSKGNIAILLIVFGVFALASSLVLSGFVLVSILVIVIAVSLFRPLRNKRRTIGLCVSLLILMAIYMLENLDLFNQFFGSASSELSHREEFENISSPVGIDAVVSFLMNGQEHGIANQSYIVLFMILVLGVAFCYLALTNSKKYVALDGESCVQESRRLCLFLLALVLIVLAIACFYVFFHSYSVTNFRNSLSSTLKSFQFDRFYLLYPTMWYLMLAAGGELLLRIASSRMNAFAAISSVVVASLLTMSLSLPTNDIIQTWQRALESEEKVSVENVTWNEFFGVDLFDEIKASVPGAMDGAKVVSVGLFPSIALYNGFDCLDAYLSSYSLRYKHDMEEVIEGELAKSSALSDYFRKWGNRCYVFSSENQNYFTLKDSGKVINELDIDTKKLESMGCEFVFSALPINNAKELDLDMIGEYERSDVPYKIVVYAIR